MMELGPQNHSKDGLSGPNSIMVGSVYGPSGISRDPTLRAAIPQGRGSQIQPAGYTAG